MTDVCNPNTIPVVPGARRKRKESLSDKGVAALKPDPKAYAHPDPELRGHYVRVRPSGAKSYVAVTLNPSGKQIWVTIGRVDAMSIDQAREQAREIMQRVRAGLPPREPRAESVAAIVEIWRKRHLVPNNVISAPEINRLINSHIIPAWGDREFITIRKSDITALLNKVQDAHGAHCADAVLAVVRQIMNWYAANYDDYNPPIVKGMRRRLPHQIARARVLSDDEIRVIWDMAGACGSFGGVVRMALLTGQRSRKIGSMKWSDIKDGVWTVPRGPREKETGGALVLPRLALTILEGQPQLADNPYVFAGRGGGPYRGWTNGKRALDRKLPEGTPQWQLHDLRRTARSLMSRARVLSEHAERTLGHAIGGVEGIYDRHDYVDEKGAALASLAELVERIINPLANVVPLHGRG